MNSSNMCACAVVCTLRRASLTSPICPTSTSQASCTTYGTGEFCPKRFFLFLWGLLFVSVPVPVCLCLIKFDTCAHAQNIFLGLGPVSVYQSGQVPAFFLYSKSAVVERGVGGTELEREFKSLFLKTGSIWQ